MRVEIKTLHVYCLSKVNYYSEKKIDSQEAPHVFCIIQSIFVATMKFLYESVKKNQEPVAQTF